MLSKSLSHIMSLNPQKLAGQKSERVMGSWKNKITATEFVEERANCDFDKEDLALSVLGEERLNIVNDVQNDMIKHPAIATPH